MAVQPTQIVESQQLPGSAAALYTAPASTRAQITKLVVVNPTGGSATYTLYMVPASGAIGASTTLTSAQAVAAGQSVVDPNVPGLVLMPGDALWGVASGATTLTIAASAVVFS